jgi:hypothetical protein
MTKEWGRTQELCFDFGFIEAADDRCLGVLALPDEGCLLKPEGSKET